MNHGGQPMWAQSSVGKGGDGFQVAKGKYSAQVCKMEEEMLETREEILGGYLLINMKKYLNSFVIKEIK